MGKILLGFLIGWMLCHRYTHIMIAEECTRLGGFFVGAKTYKCYAIIDTEVDTGVPFAILEAERGKNNEI